MLKDLVLQHNEDEISELDSFRQQMEDEKERKLKELDRQRELLNNEMAEQRAQLGRLEGANQLLQRDDMMRHKAEKQ